MSTNLVRVEITLGWVEITKKATMAYHGRILVFAFIGILGPAGKLEEILHGPEPSEHREGLIAAKKETALWAV